VYTRSTFIYQLGTYIYVLIDKLDFLTPRYGVSTNKKKLKIYYYYLAFTDDGDSVLNCTQVFANQLVKYLMDN
jgi:hypothetical protein